MNTRLLQRVLLLFLPLLIASTGMAQERCATVQVYEAQRAVNPRLPSEQEIHQAINAAVADVSDARLARGVLTIPMVVHVIHNSGVPISTGASPTENISDAQILSQVKVLNDDFRRAAGTRGFNNNAVGADSEIEFVMAKRDPNGNATNGIMRYAAGDRGWDPVPAGGYTSTYMDATIKPATIWDPTRYMNVWVVKLDNQTLGYATLPPAPSSVQGSASCQSTISSTTDGVVCIPTAYGSVDDPQGNTFNMSNLYKFGRTMTHEVGHYLGLRHTWGDGDCSVDDFCEDTPNVNGQHYQICNDSGTPTTAVPTACDNTTPRQIENYMDYSADACMNIFTKDQKARMRAIMLTSRQSLTYSNGAVAPVADDVALVDVTKPLGSYSVSTALTPTVIIRNYGSNTLTFATIMYQVNGGTPVTDNWTGSLATGATATVNLPAFTTPSTSGTQTFSVMVSSPNGQADTNTELDNITFQFMNMTAINNFPNTETFESMALNEEGTELPANWFEAGNNRTGNPAPLCYRFERHTATGASGSSTTMLRVNNFLVNAPGTEIALYTPTYDLSNASAATLTFEVSYAESNFSNTDDRLQVEVSTDGGNTWNATAIYDKAGSTLSTVSGFDGNTAFSPTASNQWRTENVSLTSFANNDVQFRFIATNSYGQNLFIDNVRVDANISAPQPEVTIAVAPASVQENSGTPIVYTFTRTITTGALTVNFQVSGTADVTTDYTLQDGAGNTVGVDGSGNGTVTFADGQNTTELRVIPNGDTTIEPNETVIVTVQNP